MKCPECVEAGQTSKVYGGDSIFSTCMAVQSYYDEDGNRHYHDNNVKSASYHCNKGHKWKKSWKTPCQVEGCDYSQLPD